MLEVNKKGRKGQDH